MNNEISTESMKVIIENSVDGIIIVDPEGTVLFMNPSSEAILNRKAEDLLGCMVGIPISTEESVEIAINRPDCGGTVAEARLAEIRWNDKKALLISLRDITELKQAEEKIKESYQENVILLQEIHHRTKNNMQIIATLLEAQLVEKNRMDIDTLLKQNIGIVYSMATIHDDLILSGRLSDIDFNSYLMQLTQKLARIYSVDQSVVTYLIDCPELLLNIDIANPLAIILNELVSNALKYAFPDNRKGVISINMQVQKSGLAELTVADNGVGIPNNFEWKNGQTLGLRMIKNIVEKQLEGSIDLECQTGTKFVLKFDPGSG